MKKNLTRVFVLALVLLFFAFSYYQEQVSNISENSESVLFKVTEDHNSLRKVIYELEDEGLLRSSDFSKLQARLHGFNKVYVGLYDFNESMSSYDILKMLNTSGAADQDVRIRLTEGFWARDMAEAMVYITDIPSEEFLSLWNDQDYIKELMKSYDFLPKEILDQKEANVLLEGYLYPDSYSINPLNTAEEITEIILQNGQNKFDSLKDLMDQTDFNTHELYTLASVVEYEAASDEDMKKVAGVFMNRLEIDMKLQSSVTVCYSLYDFEDWTECENGDNIRIDSPYNTYKYKGLPPGPILNPSIKAIEATLNYDDNDYFYFVADVYDVIDGNVHYQETYAEHEEIRIELLGY